jgi:hypothetical protein
MAAVEVGEVKPRRLRYIMAELGAIKAEVEAIIAGYPQDHPARAEAEKSVGL